MILDRTSFDHLYRETYRKMLAWALFYSRSYQDAPDILQEAYCRAWRKYRIFEGTPESFGGWIHCFVFYVSLEYRQKRKRRRHRRGRLHRGNMDRFRQRRFIDPALRAEVLDGLRVLDRRRKQRQALVLWTQGYDSQEIADLMGCSLTTATTNLYFARKYMRKTIPTPEEYRARALL